MKPGWKRSKRSAPDACRGCGEPVRRWKDERGRDQVNLDPTTELCVRCIARHPIERRHRAVSSCRRPALSPRPLRFDPRAAAARNDD